MKTNDNLSSFRLECDTDDQDPLIVTLDIGHGGMPRAALLKVEQGTRLPMNVPLVKGHVLLMQQRPSPSDLVCEIEVLTTLKDAKERGYDRVLFAQYGEPEASSGQEFRTISVEGKYGSSTYKVIHEHRITGGGPSNLVQAFIPDPKLDIANYSYIESDLPTSGFFSVIYDGPEAIPFSYSDFDLGSCTRTSGGLLVEPIDYQKDQESRKDDSYVTSRTIRVGGQTCPIFIDVANKASDPTSISIRPMQGSNKSYVLGYNGASNTSLNGSLAIPANSDRRVFFNPSGAWFENDTEVDADEEWSRSLVLQGCTDIWAQTGDRWSIRSFSNEQLRSCLTDGEPIFIEASVDTHGIIRVEGAR